MTETGLSEIDTAGILVLVLALAALLFFLATYRARASLWFGPTDRDTRPDAEEPTRRRTSGGLYLLETLAIAAACFLLTLSLRVVGFTGIGLGALSVTVCSFVVLVLAPFSLRNIRVEAVREKGHTLFPRIFLKTALLLRNLSLGSAREVDEIGRRTGRAELRYGMDLFEVLLRLRERKISEVMIPRVDVVCADECSMIAELAELVRESGHTRIPIFAGTIDSITGYVTAKDVVLRLHQGGGEQVVSSIARNPAFVPSEATIEYSLKEMQKASVALAIVTGVSGETAGLVTSKDILEEVVGDLYEDYEPEEPAYQVIDEKTALVRANVAVGDLKEIFSVAPPAQLNQTLGEYVKQSLGTEAVMGECVYDDVFSYTVVRTTGKVIWSLRVEKRD